MPDSEDPPPSRGNGGEDGARELPDQNSDDVPLLEEHAGAPSTGTETNTKRHRTVVRDTFEDGSDASSIDASLVDTLPRRVGSPVDSLPSTLGEAPSVQGSRVSSPGSSILPSFASRPTPGSPTPTFRPFDRRFQSRITSSASNSPRPSSPAFLSAHSRNVSLSSNLVLDPADSSTTTAPWEVVRWTRLNKLNKQAFSEAGRRNFGSPTCLAVSASIAIGTSKGIILLFDHNQGLKFIIGPGTKAVESGAVTAIAVSADHTTVAGGHANGSIFTWDTAKAARPFLTIPHIDEAQAQSRSADGHVTNMAVVHLGFLGTRHTALVSADDRGMAFSHLATRGTGALGRTVKTTRILGRYPGMPTPAGKPLKPSTVLGFAPLPLGNVERKTDAIGLTAMLTPYLLVIVSTTPVAQTQHKSARPKDVPAHSTMTGCLAWFPAVKLKAPDPHTGSDLSKVKLVYCWSNVLTVLDVDEIANENKDHPATLKFRARSRWKCEEPLVAVQWLGRSVLAVLTISQRLIVLEDRSMRMTESFDLLQKFIYHSDLFSTQLHSLVEQLDEEDESMHGVVADAFYMSFKAYKGRIFLLGFSEVSVGALSNWADRLIAMMEDGDYIGAIRLATSYYTGDADKLTVGLPEDTELRHSMVQDKIVEIITASLKYAFGQRERSSDEADDHHLRQLAETCFTAIQAIGATDYLFDDMYEWYESAAVDGIFHETLEPYILDEAITIAPPVVVRDMVRHYVANGWEGRLEEMICHMQTTTLDLDQITLLCKRHNLYDALTYVWNQALGDYITPAIDLLGLLVPLMTHDGDDGEGYDSVNALKIFPYLSYVLTGRVYPRGEMMEDDSAAKAKSSLYWFFFSGQTVEWPRGSSRRFLTRPGQDSEPAFPYLRLILKFDAPSFLSALNEAFEDSFLNDSPDNQATGGSRMEMAEEQIFGLTINRQYILTILLDVMNPEDFAPEDTIYLDMFIARNLPKFPQYLLFSGSILSNVLSGLCNYPGDDLADDAQLSAEYLLSVHQPADMPALMPLFRRAGFYRILKHIYTTEKQYGKLLTTYFEDTEDLDAVFDCISGCLRPQTGLDTRQLQEVLRVVEEHARDLLQLSPKRAAATLASQDTAVHRHAIESAHDRPDLQYSYLNSLLEPERPTEREDNLDQDLVERYVQLMCKFDPHHVSDYVGAVQSIDLRLENLLPTMEATGVVDAAVVLMARGGQVANAMDRLIRHLHTLESALQGLLGGGDEKGTDEVDIQEPAEELLHGLQKGVHVGIWLCQGQTRTSRRANVVQRKQVPSKDGLSTDEALWLRLIEACVRVTKNLSPAILQAVDDGAVDEGKLPTLLRSLVQHTFTSLLTATSDQGHGGTEAKLLFSTGSNLSFLRILRAFLSQAAASSPNLADLRSVLSSIFSAYAYEESILRLSNRLLERSLFVSVDRAAELRQRGWRPRGSTCEGCGKRVWGPGVAGGAVLEAWEKNQAMEDSSRKARQARAAERARGKPGDAAGKGKGKSLDTRPLSRHTETDGAEAGREAPLEPLVVLACRHIYHRSCLESLQEKQVHSVAGREREYRCPIDGDVRRM
ncbi:hypothetical protein RJ55_08381 [Drechmeria coniospora]|nr:hypothetical protein RJ55_08381 [Drechmeria coniospora]